MAEDKGASDTVQREEKILAFWNDKEIFKKSLAKPSPKGEFVFYEGPPTANGRPGIHHIEARSFKDAIPRYKTMRGYHVARRAGWDTHGLPVELEVEKALGFSGKKQIEEYGIAAFNKKCRESVLAYIEEWDRFTARIGYWVDQKKAYFTFDAPYMESLFAIVKKISDDGRLYKDYRIVPWCVSCGTALSSHELAQGYEEVKDLSITAKFKVVGENNTYLLAWTTTPWTLLGNVALAVGKDIVYGWYTNNSERVIVAKARESVLGEGWTLEKEMKGSELVGMKYEPLFTYLGNIASEEEKKKFTTAYQVHSADFVTTEDGTGIVHTAVMYGADDFALGNMLGLPKVHIVGADGLFVKGTGPFEGKSVIEPETNVEVLKSLQEQGGYFSKESYTHSYPHCWRSKNRLIYYARDSWYIRMQEVRDTLIAENKKVHWEPNHIRDGRMGEWLQNVKDWAISRERYWGTPLPVWESEGGAERIVIGSVAQLRERTKTNGNSFFLMRHGESTKNLAQISSTILGGIETGHHLTEKGIETVQQTAKALRTEGIDLIVTSPFTRSRETANLVANILGLSTDAIQIDERLREINVGPLEGKPCDEYNALFSSIEERFTKKIEGIETFAEVRRRAGEVLYELEQQHHHKKILIISHADPLWLMKLVIAGADKSQVEEFSYPETGAVLPVSFVPLPHNEEYELDLHRPYIDDVVLESENGTTLHRVKEVMDVWFDSGAMPFAQNHYPFENKSYVEKSGYPADFISEAIDQTRGWFYTLLAVGVLMGRGHAFRNVICLGHLLDGQGQKMSKSKGNIINPWEAIAQYGVDTLRFWMYHVNQPGDSKSFDEKTVKESARVLSWLDNSAKFYVLFKDEEKGASSPQVIDVWMKARTAQVVEEMTRALDEYRVYDAVRLLAGLIEDVSQWYVRRVRDRARIGDRAALTTLRETLQTVSRLLAPFSPFLAEDVYQQTKSGNDEESVHLSSWPTVKRAFTIFGANKKDTRLIHDMAQVRTLASEALMLRQKANIKVRQPLGTLHITGVLSRELEEILKDEVNIKNIVQNAKELSLDTAPTKELIAEGDEREKMRAVADARKQLGLEPRDTVTTTWGEGPFSVELSTGTQKFNVTHNAS